MPTLALYTPPSHPDGWHRVTAPGGYETWQLEVTDAQSHIMIGFHQGYPLHPRYLRRYALYRAMPTRFRPPTPPEYPVVSIRMTLDKRTVLDLAQPYRADQFDASTDQLRVRIGDNIMEADGDDMRVRLRTRAPQRVAAELTVRGETVEGTIQIDGADAIRIAGRATRAHVVSTQPLTGRRRALLACLAPPWWLRRGMRLRA